MLLLSPLFSLFSPFHLPLYIYISLSASLTRDLVIPFYSLLSSPFMLLSCAVSAPLHYMSCSACVFCPIAGASYIQTLAKSPGLRPNTYACMDVWKIWSNLKGKKTATDHWILWNRKPEELQIGTSVLHWCRNEVNCKCSTSIKMLNLY